MIVHDFDKLKDKYENDNFDDTIDVDIYGSFLVTSCVEQLIILLSMKQKYTL